MSSLSTSVPATRKPMIPPRLALPLAQTGLVLGLLVLWQGAVTAGLMAPDTVSSPLLIGQRLWSMFATGMIWPHLVDTLSATLIALVASAVLGTGLGLMLAGNRLFERTVDPIIVALQGIPRVAFGPLILLFMGVGLGAKVVLATSIALFVFSANVREGLRQVDPSLQRQVSLMGASRVRRFTMVTGPSLIPWLWASLDLALGLSLIGVIIAEFLSSTQGLGHLIAAASMGFDVTGVAALLVLMMVLVGALRGVFAVLHARFVKWS